MIRLICLKASINSGLGPLFLPPKIFDKNPIASSLLSIHKGPLEPFGMQGRLAGLDLTSGAFQCPPAISEVRAPRIEILNVLVKVIYRRFGVVIHDSLHGLDPYIFGKAVSNLRVIEAKPVANWRPFFKCWWRDIDRSSRSRRRRTIGRR